jgi:hypothetical protein
MLLACLNRLPFAMTGLGPQNKNRPVSPMKSLLKLTAVLATVLALGVIATGCKEKTTEEKMTDAAKDGMKKTDEAAKDAAKKVDEAMKK